MPVFPTLNKIFIHIPRTGGTSILEYLKSKYTIDDRFGDFKHYTLENYKKIDSFYDYELFTTVRNPYDRIVSYFNYHMATDKNVAEELYSEIKTGNLYDIFNLYLLKNLNNCPCKFGREKPLLLWKTQSSFLDSNEHINLLRFETLNCDFNKFMKIECHLPKITSIPKEFKIYKREEFFTKSSVDIITNYYMEDFKRFNYEVLHG